MIFFILQKYKFKNCFDNYKDNKFINISFYSKNILFKNIYDFKF